MNVHLLAMDVRISAVILKGHFFANAMMGMHWIPIIKTAPLVVVAHLLRPVEYFRPLDGRMGTHKKILFVNGLYTVGQSIMLLVLQ